MTHASVFSGIGGPEVAASMLGWQNLFHCEINPFGRSVLNYWFSESKSYDDVTKTDFSEWRGRVDVLTGGFPCQPFSHAGKRKGAEDDRYLWLFMHRAIQQIRPTWFVCENVAGILTMVEQGCETKMGVETDLFGENRGIYRKRSIFTVERICRDVEADGYEVQSFIIPACSVGAPHKRDRVFIVGRIVEVTANANCNRGYQGNQYLQSEKSDGAESFSFRRERPTSDTKSNGDNRGAIGILQTERRQTQQYAECGEYGCLWTTANSYQFRHVPSKQRSRWQRETVDKDSQNKSLAQSFGYSMLERWRDFPTVSPIHRGNDGLPFNVDNLTIPYYTPKGKNTYFTKWREESLKAYGNAIVPQVMYQIFKAIEETEKSNH